MTQAAFLRTLRRKLADVDTTAARQSDEQLLALAADCLVELVVRAPLRVADLELAQDETTEEWNFTADPPDDQALILAVKTAVEQLWVTYTGRLSRGELGVSWRSGLEEESTITAEKAYQQRIRDLELELDELLLITGAPSSATRPQ